MPLYKELAYIGPPRAFRNAATKYGITIHATANTASAYDEARYARNRTDGTSSHFYVDDRDVIQSLNTDLGANHAGSAWANDHYIAYEFTGTNGWSTAKWRNNINWKAVAAQMARDCKRWNIPVRHLTVKQMQGHERGFNTHDDCRRAFGGTDHTDPGSNFPLSYLLDLVKNVYDGDDMELNDNFKLTAGQAELLSFDEEVQNGIRVSTAVGGAYAFSRMLLRWSSDIEKKIDALSAVPTPELTTEQLDYIATKVAEKLSVLRFDAE